MGGELEYYMSRSSSYKQACGILRTRISQMMEVLSDDTLSNDEKVNILSGEMSIIENDDMVSYDTLDIYDDYTYFIDHSKEYENYFETQEKGKQK